MSGTAGHPVAFIRVRKSRAALACFLPPRQLTALSPYIVSFNLAAAPSHHTRSRERGSGVDAFLRCLVTGAWIHAFRNASSRCDNSSNAECALLPSAVGISTHPSLAETMEVAQGWDTAKHSAIVMTQGQLLQLAAIGGQQFGNLQLAALGEYLHADSLIVAHFPELSKVLPTMVSEQLQGAGPLSVNSAAVVESMDRLTQQVQTDAAFWRDGTAPGDPIKTAVQQAVFTAGELAALLAGQRGVTMVQLWNGWDPTKGQPIYNPLAITMLEKVLTAPGISCCSSVAPGGVGLTGIVYADREPFASWALHLASFGCQANVVAGSSYYKLLIGQLLGYKLENVLGYVAASGEPASPALQQQVARDIKNLSKVKPKLPWSADDKNVRKARTANKAVTEKRTGGFSSNKPAAGFGAKA